MIKIEKIISVLNFRLNVFFVKQVN